MDSRDTRIGPDFGVESRASLRSCSSSLLLSSLELSATIVYEPEIRALLGTASHFFGLRRAPLQRVRPKPKPVNPNTSVTPTPETRTPLHTRNANLSPATGAPLS